VTTYHIEDVLEISKASLRRKIERDFDRPDAMVAATLLRRRGKMYLLNEIEYITGYMISGHDDCVESHPEDYTPVEVHQVKLNQERYARVLAKLEGLLGRKPVFGQLTPPA
jgi:hypothetical protein